MNDQVIRRLIIPVILIIGLYGLVRYTFTVPSEHPVPSSIEAGRYP